MICNTVIKRLTIQYWIVVTINFLLNTFVVSAQDATILQKMTSLRKDVIF
jgi:hypothetical protein